ncbi:hypothetical protein Smic_31390 [Streptomyces microflavus]|uniref:Histidine kinase/HSP90-like ATPase domain-containing protein n=1 Tax=Streptomyces microflavus TaxID=1919 RepID=A0A7J0CQ13_STRMI|nr:hypothetical protein Smic_31390 [Streptomyces microflavus]
MAHLGAWGLPSESAAHIVAELAANASVHGRVQGRDFQLTLAVSGRTLRIEVTDTRGDSAPPGPGAVKAPEDDSEHGRGLLIVEALADHWGIAPDPYRARPYGQRSTSYGDGPATGSCAGATRYPAKSAHRIALHRDAVTRDINYLKNQEK